VYADDHSRVILEEYPGVPGSDYMNANYVKGSSGCARTYIASQGPLPNTLVDFWRMIWESDVTVIVMACNERESGKYKCESYWPQDNDDPQQYGNITGMSCHPSVTHVLYSMHVLL
jgi:tyrosine-protein phosphatase non-receptor type 12/18/22